MRVIATSDGFINGSRIRAGRIFEVPDGTQGKWFVPADAAPKPKRGPKSEKVPDTFSEVTRRDADTVIGY